MSDSFRYSKKITKNSYVKTFERLKYIKELDDSLEIIETKQYIYIYI